MLYFSPGQPNGVTNCEVWKTDGTAAPTKVWTAPQTSPPFFDVGITCLRYCQATKRLLIFVYDSDADMFAIYQLNPVDDSTSLIYGPASLGAFPNSAPSDALEVGSLMYLSFVGSLGGNAYLATFDPVSYAFKLLYTVAESFQSGYGGLAQLLNTTILWHSGSFLHSNQSGAWAQFYAAPAADSEPNSVFASSVDGKVYYGMERLPAGATQGRLKVLTGVVAPVDELTVPQVVGSTYGAAFPQVRPLVISAAVSQLLAVYQDGNQTGLDIYARNPGDGAWSMEGRIPASLVGVLASMGRGMVSDGGKAYLTVAHWGGPSENYYLLRRDGPGNWAIVGSFLGYHTLFGSVPLVPLETTEPAPGRVAGGTNRGQIFARARNAKEIYMGRPPITRPLPF